MKTATVEKTETAAAFYARRAKECAESANRLKQMYSARKIKDTPLTDALWDGYTALKNLSEEFAVKCEKSKVPQ